MTADLPRRLDIRHAGAGDDAFPYATLGQGAPVLSLTPYAVPIELQWYLRMSRRYLGELASRYRVVVVGDRYERLDLTPGHHDLPDGFLDQFVTDLVAVLDACGIERAHILAEFLTSIPATVLAARHPERVQSLLLWNGMLSGDIAHAGTEAQKLLNVVRSSEPNVAARSWIGAAGISADARDAKQQGEVFGLLKTREIPDRLSVRGLGSSDATGAAPAVACPTLVVSPEDAVMPGRAANEALARAIPGARLVRTPGAAISSHLEDHAVSLPLVLNWLTEVGSSTSMPPDPRLDQLTPREREVCQHIARGETNQQIAESLSISPWTVQRHVSNAIRKTGAANRAALAALVAPTLKR